MRLFTLLAESFSSGAGVVLGVLVIDAVFWDGRLGRLIEAISEALRDLPQ